MDESDYLKTLDSDTATDEEESTEPETVYANVGEWVTEWLLPTYSRPLDDVARFRWDPQWWRYPEVVMRLEPLWISWEKMRLEGGPSMVVFYRDYLDPMMRVILDPDGPFHTYNPHKDKPDATRENLPLPLPHTEMPAGLLELL
ncbi:DUF4913 domain-containing protein [Brevibacterium linens]|uniref:DUF4913 domain-containing protein n=1 Tax=Brevibacterium linens TaxID=1703 RepID=UPI003F88D6A9